MPFRLDKEVREIKQGLALANNRNQFEIIRRGAVNAADMQQAIVEISPHIVHFSGQGAGESGLILESSDHNGSHVVTTAALANLFALFADIIECVVLNACYSEIQAQAINQHIGYVVGMNHEIADKAAINFSVGFYNALWAGRHIDFAYRSGCTAIQLNSSQESQVFQRHLIPILKVRSDLAQPASSPLPVQPPVPVEPSPVAPPPTPAAPEVKAPPVVKTVVETPKADAPLPPLPLYTSPPPSIQTPINTSPSASPEAVRSASRQPRYTTQGLIKEFITGLEDFSDWVETDKIKNALGRDLIRKLRTQEQTIRDRLEATFSIVIVGDFKRGKSTLVNALLGIPVASTAVTTETVSINEIEYGEELRVEAVLKDGRVMELDPSQIESSKLRPILQNLPQPISHLRIEAPVEWLKGLKLVDTPGTGDMMGQFDKQVHNYLSQADVLLYVMFTSAVLSESERAFLTSSVMPQDFPKVFFIVNRIDELDDANTERLLKNTEKQISEVFPNAYTFGVSALDEFSRIQKQPRPNPSREPQLARAFQRLRGHLYNSALHHKETIQLDRATDLMDQMLISFEKSMSMVRSAIQGDRQKLDEAVSHCEENQQRIQEKINQHTQAMSQSIDELCQETIDWMNGFITRLEKEAIPDISQFELSDVQKHYHFFLTDMLRRAVNNCLNEHSARIAENVDSTLKLIASDFHQFSNSHLLNVDVASITFGDTPWTNIDTLNLLMEFSGSDGIFELASHLLIRQARKLETSHGTRQYANKLKSNMHQLRKAVEKEITLAYANFYQRIESAINQSYQQTIESSNFALQQAQELCKQDSQDLIETKAGLTDAIALLEDTRTFLQSFKQKLWIADAVPIKL